MRYRQAFALTLTLALLIGLAGPGQAQKALKIFMIPKFTGAAYFAATEKGAKDAVAELKGRGVAIDFLYTGPSVANTDEEIRMIDDLVAQKPDAIIISPNNADAMVAVAKRGRGERTLRRREYRSWCLQPELLDRRHEGADAGEVPEDAAGRHPLWAGQTRGVVQRGPGRN